MKLHTDKGRLRPRECLLPSTENEKATDGGSAKG